MAVAFGTAFVDSAIQTPVNGLLQLFNPKEAKSLKLVDTKQQELGSTEWYCQLAGSGLGSLSNFVGLRKVFKGTADCIKFAGAASSSKVWRPLANTISLAENSAFCKKPMTSAATIGALYGGVLTPVNPKGEDMTAARLKNASIGALSVAAMVAPNQIRLSTNAFRFGETGSKFTETIALALGGPLSGLVHSEARSLSNGKLLLDFASRDFKESMLAYSIMGAGYAGYRSLSSAKKPLEVKEYESTEKLIATRRPETTKPIRTREETIAISEQWNLLIKDADVFIRKTINETPISQGTKLLLTQLHKKGFNEILSNPANNRNFEPYEQHWESMQKLLEVSAKQEALASSMSKQALDRWNQMHPETPAQPGDLVVPDPLHPKWLNNLANQKPQLPATLAQVQQKTNSPATEEQLNRGQDHLPAHDGEWTNYQLSPKPAEPSAADLVPKATGLRSGFLGQRISDTEQAMSNPESQYYAKRANMNTQRQSERKQSDLAETICSNKNTDPNKKSGLKLKTTTFDKFGYTAEQANRQAIVKQMTSSSKDTAAGIGAPEELQKHKPEPWDRREEP